FDVPWTYAAWSQPARIGCRFGRLIVEIIRRQTNSASPLCVGSDGRNFPLNGQEVEAAAHQPAEIGGSEVWNGTLLRLPRHNNAHRNDQRRAAQQRHFGHHIRSDNEALESSLPDGNLSTRSGPCITGVSRTHHWGQSWVPIPSPF